MGLHARLMSYALRRLTASISKSKTTVVFINQLRAQISSGYGHGPTETTTGGRALKFYSSVRMEVKRGKQVTAGDVVTGHELWIKVVKNKQAPPFRTAHTTLIYGKGVPKAVAALDMALDHGVVKRKGSWLAYKGETIGQGKETVANYLQEHPELLDEITQDVLRLTAEGLGLIDIPNPDIEDNESELTAGMEELLQEGAIRLDLDTDFEEEATE